MDDAKGVVEVARVDQDGVQDLLVDDGLVKVDVGHLLADALKRRFHAQLLNVRTHVSVDLLCDSLDVDVVSESHVSGFDVEDFLAAVGVGDAHVELTVEPPGTTQSGLDHGGSVGGADYDHLAGSLQAVHQGQQLGDDALLDFTPGLQRAK